MASFYLDVYYVPHYFITKPVIDGKKYSLYTFD